MRSCDDEFIKKVFIKIEMILCMRDRILRGVRFDVMKLVLLIAREEQLAYVICIFLNFDYFFLLICVSTHTISVIY